MQADVAQSQKAQPGPVALFVSDVHLQASLTHTAEAFLDFLQRHATGAQRLYLLGDLFEYWAGDDDLDDPFHRRIADAIKAVGAAGTSCYWIGGNRDFLAGERFAAACGLSLLEEPYVVELAGHRIVLVHGDAECTDDTGYMLFREQVRTPAWQQQFLAMPLAQRKAVIDGMRSGSRAAQQTKSYEIMDVNADAIAALFGVTDADVMVHGHTHRPGEHVLDVQGKRRVRYVLPDWDCDGAAKRGGWLGLAADGAMTRYDLDGLAIR
ncbi:UDP-2,3-diacylglucosamine diphosphatase [Oxalobacteraceae bacterium OM1]|nr:UDP-2,3-diacylglucosamine diphosphatase [Oxalobacteraceae bacterium OM1]